MILPQGAVKSLRIYTSTHGDVVIKKGKKKKRNGRMAVLLCAVCGSCLGHMVLVPPLCTLPGDADLRAESFPAPPAVWTSAFSWAV